MRYETLSPKAAKLYKIIISVDIILSSLFLIKYFTMDNKNVHNYVSTSLDITIVIWILEVIIIAFKGISNTTKPVQRESFDLKEEFLTEENVKKSVMQKKKDKTVNEIAHRNNSIAGFDRIILFKEGRIVGQGTFEELLHTDSYFMDLYNANVQ